MDNDTLISLIMVSPLIWLAGLFLIILDYKFLVWVCRVASLVVCHTFKWLLSFGTEGGSVSAYYNDVKYEFEILPIRWRK